jgi:hypothetical protein
MLGFLEERRELIVVLVAMPWPPHDSPAARFTGAHHHRRECQRSQHHRLLVSPPAINATPKNQLHLTFATSTTFQKHVSRGGARRGSAFTRASRFRSFIDGYFQARRVLDEQVGPRHGNRTRIGRLVYDAVMKLLIIVIAALTARLAHADNVYEICKGESKRIVAGTGKLSIAIVLPDDFPGRTERSVLFPIGERLAVAEKATVILVAEVDRALKLVGAKAWTEKGDACSASPSLVAILGLKHPNLSTAHTTIVCDDKKACLLRVDLERHGRPSAERWVRYEAPLSGPKDDLKVIAAAAPKLVAKGPPPDAPTAGLVVDKLATGKVRVRSDADGALEADHVMEASTAFAACGIKGRKAFDVRGYYAEWMLSAKGLVYQATVKPFGGKDPADEAAAECLKKALEATQLPCPRDSRAIKVKTAICL